MKNTKDGRKTYAKTHHIGEAEQEKTSYSMFNLSETSSDPLYGASLKMEIDTGASATSVRRLMGSYGLMIGLQH